MARSVDYLTGAQAVAYLSAHDLPAEDWAWDDFEADIAAQLKTLFPSLQDCQRWDGNETRIFLSNGHAEIGISEYNGLVSVSLRALDDWDGAGTGLHEAWAASVKDKFESIGNLTRRGSFSNGEAVFTTKQEPEHTYSSKEGLCEWLEGAN